MHLYQSNQQPRRPKQFSLSDLKLKQEQFPGQDIVESLQQNKYGRVVRVTQHDISIVIKQLIKSEINDDQQLEQKTTKQIDACNRFIIDPDPYILKFYEVWKSPLYYNISMQWCDNMTLKYEMERDAIANERPELCVLYFLSILYALTACHKRGIPMHRDMKPQNILITHKHMQKYLKLADFGTCSFTNVAKSFQGTSLYIAPEVWGLSNEELNMEFINNNGYLSNCDIWSFGVIMFQLYNGLHPTYRCLQFPYIEEIFHLNQSPKNFMSKVHYYYSTIFQLEEEIEKRTLIFKKWRNLSPINIKRMQALKNIIMNMLQPHPLRRYSYRGLYQDIKLKKWEDLVNGLKETDIVKNFQQYYEAEVNIRTGSNHLESTVC